MLVIGIAYGSLAFRRSRPLAAGCAIFGLWIFANVALTDVEPLQTPLVVVLVIAYAMGAYTTGRAGAAAPFVDPRSGCSA